MFSETTALKLGDQSKRFSPKQKIAIEFIAMNPAATKKEIADHVGVDPVTIYDWQREPNFVDSVYYRIIEIIDKKKFPNDVNLYPGDYIINIAKEIIKKKKIKDFSILNKIHEKLTFESLKVSMKMIKDNLKLLGVEHDSFVYESELVKKKLVTKAIKKAGGKAYIIHSEAGTRID